MQSGSLAGMLPDYEMLASGPIVQSLLSTLVTSLQAVLLGTMMLRRLHRRFPIFFAYTAVQVARGVVLHWILYLCAVHRLAFRDYFIAYWTTDVISLALSFIILYRIFGAAFREYPSFRDSGRTLFLYGLAALLVAAIVITATSPGHDVARIIAGIVVLERSITLVRCGLLVLMFAAAAFLGLAWRDHVFGLAVGFGVWSTVDLAVMAIRAYRGPSADMFVTWLTPLGYSLAVAVWFVYFVLPRREQPGMDGLPDVPVAEWKSVLETVGR